jgi:hypothetical protein
MEQVARHALEGDCIAVRIPGPEMLYTMGEAAPDFRQYSGSNGTPADNQERD